MGGPQQRLKQVATPLNSLAHAHREAFGAHGSQSQAHGGSDELGGEEQKASLARCEIILRATTAFTHSGKKSFTARV